MARPPVSSVQVGPYKFTVEFAPLNKFMSDPDYPLFGQTEFDTQVIRLDPGIQGPDLLRDTLWHEVKHVCWMLAGLPKQGGKEEDVVRVLATAELQVLRQNPKLVAYLTGAHN